MPVRCGNISHEWQQGPFAFVSFLKYEFWKTEGEIIFLEHMCFLAGGGSAFMFDFHVNESLKRNERRKEKGRTK